MGMEGEGRGKGGEGRGKGKEGEGREGGLCSSNISFKKALLKCTFAYDIFYFRCFLIIQTSTFRPLNIDACS